MVSNTTPRGGSVVDPPLDAEALDEAVGLLRGRRVAVLTGAGVSTDSGIPDYRGAGAPPRNPMTFQQFLSSDRYRKRYWAGSHLGWKAFRASEPNRGHRALAELERAGVTNGVVTQNVDNLHVRAGSQRVVDLHGTVDRVVCLTCGQSFARDMVSSRLAEANPWLEHPESVRLAPDGDVEVDDIDAFEVPVCTVCGGMLKPDVVFFGEFVPVERFAEARSLVVGAEALLIAGSSLVVNSGIRLLDQATRRRLPVVVVNRGVTKGDGRAAVKLNAGTSETLAALAERLIP
ncbi:MULTISPECIES: Sir2 family NAD-dependent protein deacetylase [unclassified Frigoribacterium]|uniref:Sir2 family NAD-dependent protein deacetylase n=1 Tax=unclassified Frigoribacterium TaxID=2627005 RepID=UPI0006F9AD73|nr:MULTISPECIES: Sir2 family NAD-dependent protein deacetylase [unclassified Frigoribacterium]KQO82923.1 NAD-dependent deacetylase [Frigoribacterium sp. Leaf263]KQR64382.1 NAD-dependent deacetylase [Frigoribacterium sp. Leaf172]